MYNLKSQWVDHVTHAFVYRVCILAMVDKIAPRITLQSLGNKEKIR